MKNIKNNMKRKGGEFSSNNSVNNNKKFVPNSHNNGQMNAATGMAYSPMIPSPYNMTGEFAGNSSMHQTYYTNYTNLQYIVDPNQYAAYYRPIPPHIASGIYNQPPPPPLPPDDSGMAKPPLPPGMPPTAMSPPQNNWNRKANQRSPNPNNKFPKFQKNQSLTSVVCKTDTTKSVDEITVSKKSKRKPMSTRYTRKKEWDREDAIKAIALENEFNRLQKLPMLILKFPDPELNKDIVKSFSNQIDNVHFQQPSTARYCYVTLRPDANIKEVEHEIGNIPFGTGKVIVKKHNHDERTEVAPEEIDPYTLYIGNLPTNITVAAVKQKFPTAQRIDIGFAQKMKYTRYAFIRYETIEESTEAFRNTFSLEMESRSLIVRFRRQKGNVGLPGETRLPKAKQLPPTPEHSSPIESPQTTVEIKTIPDDIIIKSITENNVVIKERTETPTSENSLPLNKMEEMVQEPEIAPISPPPMIPVEPQPLPPSPPPPPQEDIDSKANVIEEAMKLMSEKSSELDSELDKLSAGSLSARETISTPDLDSSCSVTIKQEKNENEIFDDLIIGTRVKEEPEDYEDDNDFDDDESDDEMIDEDDDDEEEQLFDDKEEDDHDAALYDRFNHFDDMAFKDLDDNEKKPNVEELVLSGIAPNTNGVMNNSIPNNNNTRTLQKQSEYDDLFDSLNPNDNLEL